MAGLEIKPIMAVVNKENIVTGYLSPSCQKDKPLEFEYFKFKDYLDHFKKGGTFNSKENFIQTFISVMAINFNLAVDVRVKHQLHLHHGLSPFEENPTSEYYTKFKEDCQKYMRVTLSSPEFFKEFSQDTSLYIEKYVPKMKIWHE